MPKLLIFDAFTLLIPEKTVANYALLRCNTFSLKIWVCKIFDKFHVCLKGTQIIQGQLQGLYGVPTMLFFLQGVCLTYKGVAFYNDNNDKKMITIESILFFLYHICCSFYKRVDWAVATLHSILMLSLVGTLASRRRHT